MQGIIEARQKAVQDKEERRRLELEKRQKHKQFVSERLAQDREKREETKQQLQLFQTFMQRQDVLSVLVRHRKQLKHVFQSFARLNDKRSSSRVSDESNTLNLNKFSKFCLQFALVPTLLSSEDAVSIFKQALKGKLQSLKETSQVGGDSAALRVDFQVQVATSCVGL